MPNRPTIRTLWFLVLAAPALLGGCDNRTQEARRWDQIAQRQNGYDTQSWKDAKSPWSSAEHHEGLAW